MTGLRTAGAVAVLLLLTACGPAGSSTASPASTSPATPGPGATPTSTVAPAAAAPTPDGPSPPASAGTDAAPAAAEPCTGSTLDVSATPARPDGAGTVSDLVFRNTGPAPCMLRGYPGVSFVAGNEGTQVGPRAAISGPRAEVRLEPGRAATAPLRVRDTGGYPASACVPADVRGVRVAPPGGTGGKFVPRPGSVCSGEPDVPQATVGSVVAR